ncbi:hypothetical protein RSAG8_08642, partial [Rhizoctonia solani AG-8 WAC10335]
MSVSTGAALFREYCQKCHAIEPGKQSRDPNAPHLRGVYGRPVNWRWTDASTSVVKHDTGVWDDNTLDRYLRADLPGATRRFKPEIGTKDRKALIAYLKANPL